MKLSTAQRPGFLMGCPADLNCLGDAVVHHEPHIRLVNTCAYVSLLVGALKIPHAAELQHAHVAQARTSIFLKGFETGQAFAICSRGPE